MAATLAGGLEVDRADAAAQVLAQQVRRILVFEAGRDHGELRALRRGLAHPAQDGAQLRQAVRHEGHDARTGSPARHAPASPRTRSSTRSAAAATRGESSSPNVSTSAASMANTMTSSGMS